MPFRLNLADSNGGRRDFHNEDGQLFRWTKRPRHLVVDRRQALQKRGYGHGVGFGELGNVAPGHRSGQDSAIRGSAGQYRSDDLLRSPGAEPGFLVGVSTTGFGRETMERTAQCHCGSLRVTASGEPERVYVCHCRACQRRTGGVVHFRSHYPKSQVRIEGDNRIYERDADSGF
jgi:hypothetical protein